MKNLQLSFNKIYVFLFYSIIFGTTLLFSTLTRSVFEVNKIGVVKIALSIAGIIFFYDRLLGNKKWFYDFKDNKTINSILLIVLGSNFLSTIFSKNIIISIFGCYDRWEGIITISFYLFMVYLIINVKGINIIKKLIFGLVISAALSSLYGIVQSFGVDIINWSLDPSLRVFGSINNPVHYCAIMGMSIPIIIGFLFNTIKDNDIQTISWKPIGYIILYYSSVLLFLKIIFPGIASTVIDPLFSMLNPGNAKVSTSFSNSYYQILTYVIILGAPFLVYFKNSIKRQTNQNIINLLFNALLLTIYTTYLSYSRATWLGVTSSIALIFIITLINNKLMNKKNYSIFCSGLLTFSAFCYLVFLFNVHTISNTVLIIMFLLLSSSVLLITTPLKQHNSLINFILIILLIVNQFFVKSILSLLILSIIIALIYFQKYKKKDLLSIKVFLMIIIFMNIQFISISLIQFINCIALIASLLLAEHSTSIKNPFSTNIIFKWKLIIICLFALTFISPKIYMFSKNLEKTEKSTQLLINASQNKIKSYENVAIKGTARTSMWKSALPWFMDHILIGSGLDTIKYYYPKYRRPEYGKLEGGHNYTPDRLHNEYLNTLATKGLLGFVIHYIVFIGFIFASLILYIHDESVKNRFLIIGLLGGALVYLGQVLFNFGVVATLVYFYLFLGLAYGLRTNEKTI